MSPAGPELRQLLALPRSDRPPVSGTGRTEGEDDSEEGPVDNGRPVPASPAIAPTVTLPWLHGQRHEPLRPPDASCVSDGAVAVGAGIRKMPLMAGS